jgi:peptide/nickel transport system substrate-binding protein
LALLSLASAACGGAEPPAPVAPAPDAAPAAALTPAAQATLRPDAGRDPFAPGPCPIDAFQPRGASGALAPAAPAYGGSVTVHLQGMPAHLNGALENSAVAQRILAELGASLLAEDWETLALVPDAAESWSVMDLVELSGPVEPSATSVADGLGGAASERWFLWGVVRREGEHWRVARAASAELPALDALLPAVDVAAVLPGCAFEFRLRPGVRWQDGHAFDARDVRFSFEMYANPHVDCDEQRATYQKFLACLTPDARTVRFLARAPYWQAEKSLGLMPLLPAHLYDRGHPDHPRFDPAASAEARAAEINASPHNREYVGLGPYRLTRFDAQVIEAERWDGYWDAARGGYLDRLRWRYVPDDSAAWQALLDGELDYFDRLTTSQYLGAATEQEAFTSRCIEGFLYAGQYSYVAWNLADPLFADVRVRQAMAHAVDLERWKRDYYAGLAEIVTGPQNPFHPGYDRAILPRALDLARARTLLAEAGWIDRDGDGWVDRGGAKLAFELATVANQEPAARFASFFVESLAKVGVEVHATAADYGTLAERGRTHQFQALYLAWITPPEVDPEPAFHSRWALADGLNYPGLADPEVDRLIELGQATVDAGERAAVWRALHARLHELQPYLFLFNPARKFALASSIRGHQAVRLDPNYVLRRWYHPAGTPGTRAQR